MRSLAAFESRSLLRKPTFELRTLHRNINKNDYKNKPIAFVLGISSMLS
jgi:hypothetical protein